MSVSQLTVLVTRSAGQSSQFSKLLLAQGMEALEMPALEIRAPASWQPLDMALADLSNYDWLLLTSANAVHAFFERLSEVGDIRDLNDVKLAVVGKKTASVLKNYGLKPNFVPPEFVADSLAANFPEAIPGLKLLFPRVESGGREILVRELTNLGGEVMEVPAYESDCPQEPDAEAIAALHSQDIDIITFASSKTVRCACKLFEQGLGAEWKNYLQSVAIASIGPKTSETCRELLGRVDIEAAEYTLDGLARAIKEWASVSSD